MQEKINCSSHENEPRNKQPASGENTAKTSPMLQKICKVGDTEKMMLMLHNQ